MGDQSGLTQADADSDTDSDSNTDSDADADTDTEAIFDFGRTWEIKKEASGYAMAAEEDFTMFLYVRMNADTPEIIL